MEASSFSMFRAVIGHLITRSKNTTYITKFNALHELIKTTVRQTHLALPRHHREQNRQSVQFPLATDQSDES